MKISWRFKSNTLSTLSILTAAVLLAASPSLFAEDSNGSGPNAEQRKAHFEKFLQEHPEMKQKLDTNGDGTVSREEAEAGRGQFRPGPRGERWNNLKNQADANNDGTISGEERKAAKEQWLNNHPGVKAKLDTDGDGQISDDEKKAAKEQWQEKKQERREAFKEKYDADKDGKLSKDERQTARQDWKENHPGRGPQGGPGAGPERSGKRGGWFHRGNR